MMNNNPSELHRFYTEDSQFCHTEDPSGRAHVVHGLDAIQKRVGELNFDNNTNIDLSDGAYDVQESLANPQTSSILVVVTGHFSKKEQSPSPFTHTFMLAKPEVRRVTSRFLELHLTSSELSPRVSFLDARMSSLSLT